MGIEHDQEAQIREKALIGIDPGEKRVGIAIKPSGQMEGIPYRVVEPDDGLASLIIRLSNEYDTDTVVVGMPRDINGNDTAQTTKARAFAGALAEETDLHVLMHDEFSTSERARERLQPTSREQEKRELDAVAAAILLEDFVESSLA